MFSQRLSGSRPNPAINGRLRTIHPPFLGIGYANDPVELQLSSIVNASNPFQLPAWSEINREQRRRARFKKMVFTIIAVIVLLLIGLLIEGCQSERAALAIPAPPSGQVQAVPTVPPTEAASAELQRPAVSPQSEPAATSPAAPAISDEKKVPVASQSGAIYVVKSGDTLTRIARTYRTTIGAIEAANGLTGDHILVGAKLKIPEA